MFVLLWATLLFCVRGSNADTGASSWGKKHCQNDFCVTLSEGELTAEVGLCVVIPCSFTPGSGFKTQHIIWYKCEANTERCDKGDIIFHSDNKENVQPGFKGRVSLLQPDMIQKNCSIIINDLKASGFRSYQLRIAGDFNGKQDGFTFTAKTSVSIKGLHQKPTAVIPTLTEGQQVTLTCTAPGLCSGSVPEITWTWRGAGGTESHITGNITALKSENLTAITQRHISTLTFNPSAEHHNTSISCKISFTGQTTTEETSTLNVNYVKKIKISGNKSAKEGETLNLTCGVESFPPSLIVWSKLGSNTNLHEDTGSATLVILNATTEHSGQYVCTVEYMNNTLRENISVTVKCASGYSQHGFCVSLSEGKLTAEAGLCVVIPCSFTPSGGFTPKNLVWHKCEASEQACGDGDIIFHSKKNTSKTPQLGFEGRVKLLEPDVSQKNCSIIINDLKMSDSGSYQLRVNGKVNEQNLGYTFTSRVAVSVEDLQQKPTVVIPTLTEGQQATLTCTAPGLCSGSVPEITWTWRGAGGTESHITGNITALKTENLSAVTQRHISTLTFNPSAEHHNTSIKCKISFTGGTTIEETSTLEVNWFSKIQNGSGCVLQSEVLTCACISEGFPLPTIKWPLLKNRTEYSIITTVSNHTIKSTLSLTGIKHGNNTVECVSNNGNGEAKKEFLIHLAQKDEQSSVWRLGYLEIIIAFLIGVLFSAVVCWLAKKFCRKKQKGSGNLDEALEMVAPQVDPLVNDDQALQTLYANSVPKEVVYANIDFSLLERNGAREAAKRQESTKTEYAEIKKAVKQEQEDGQVAKGEMLEGREEEVMMRLEMKHCEPEEVEGEEEPVYSIVNDIMDEI